MTTTAPEGKEEAITLPVSKLRITGCLDEMCGGAVDYEARKSNRRRLMIPVWRDLFLGANFGAKTQAISDASSCFLPTGRMYGRSKSGE